MGILKADTQDNSCYKNLSYLLSSDFEQAYPIFNRNTSELNKLSVV